MAEENEVTIRIIETRKIPIDKIKINNIQARQQQVTKSLEIFAEQIRNLGLIQPIVVYPKGDEYELIVGQRRYYAHKQILKWSEILAMIIEKPKDDMMATTISWIENEARQKMSNRDKIRHVVNMNSQQISQMEISETLGISRKEVKSCIGLPRVPDVVRNAVESGIISSDVAIRATDAKGFEKHETPEESGNDILALAKLIQENKLSDKEQQNMVDFGINNPKSDNETLLEDGIKNTRETINIDLSSSNAKRLEKYAQDNEHKSKSFAAAQLVLEGLDQSGD